MTVEARFDQLEAAVRDVVRLLAMQPLPAPVQQVEGNVTVDGQVHVPGVASDAQLEKAVGFLRQLADRPPVDVHVPDVGPVRLDAASVEALAGLFPERVRLDDDQMQELRRALSQAAGGGTPMVAGPSGQRRVLEGIQRGLTDYETRLDYAGRSDSSPVFVGKAAQGTPVDGDGWQVQRLEYDGDGRLVRVQVRGGSWSGRADGWL